MPRNISTNRLQFFFIAAFLAAAAASPALAANDVMTLSVTSFESGISYRDVQWHSPIGMISNPCSQADYFAATIDWGDGTGEHKPDTNVRLRPFSTENKTLVVDSGVYLFWDDSHAFARSGAYVAKTRLSFHCLGDPPGNQEIVSNFPVHVYARIPVNQVEFVQNGKNVGTVAGHATVDLSITLDSPAPPSGTWVKLEAIPAGTFNSLPAFYRISPFETQETIRHLEVRKPAAVTSLIVKASTVGRPEQTSSLSITP
ncbi:MAG TPA: hypothetical protein VMJ93_12485 [Verrucomicrobiae bacterium]|nr:hypothetical protein [Verrucomicrobiae bacterium]